jgi:tetratricopeptide (TPR) repeat protein
LNFGETDKAIEVTKRSLDVKANDDKMSISFNLLAKCFYYNGKLQDAQRYVNKSLEFSVKTQNEWSLAEAYIIEALILFKLDKNNIPTAIDKSQASLELLKKLNDDESKLYRAHDIANVNKCLGKFYLAKGDVYSSIKHLKKAKSIMKKEMLIKHSLYAKILRNLGVAFLKNGNKILSRKYLKQSLELCKRILPELHPVTVCVSDDLKNIF